MKINSLSLFLLLCLFFTGCGKGFVPADGKVAFDDGTPLKTGSITFETATFMASGNINPDGTFVLTSLDEGDGLPPGDYTVTIAALDPARPDTAILLTDEKYSNPTTTPLKAKVNSSAEQNHFEFTVTKPVK